MIPTHVIFFKFKFVSRIVLFPCRLSKPGGCGYYFEIYHLPSLFCPSGSLVMEHPGEASSPFQGCILFGTVNGTIGEKFHFKALSGFTAGKGRVLLFTSINLIIYICISWS